MISEKFLLSIGFTKIGEANLPNWYNIFESDPEVTTSKAYELEALGHVFTIYLTPKGMFGECIENNEEQNNRDYFRVESTEGLIENIGSYAGARINWESNELPF
jgi:hypothetical protein